MKCKQCGNEFEAKRKTALYCSASCRVTASRVSVTDDDSEVSVTRPPCTDKQLSSPCHACKQVKMCDYLHNQNNALPGDADYKGVCDADLQLVR